jgi:hypothetical protein
MLVETGGLFRLSIKMLQSFSANKQDFIPLVNMLGVLFQIRDDYMNICAADVRVYTNNLVSCVRVVCASDQMVADCSAVLPKQELL